MPRRTLVIEEITYLLKMSDASNDFIARFKEKAEEVFGRQTIKEYDNVSVSSGFGAISQKGFVDLEIDKQRIQMEAKKAREIGLMLIECAEAATSDEIFVKLLERIGIKSKEQAVGNLLLELREIRQGSKGIVNPN